MWQGKVFYPLPGRSPLAVRLAELRIQCRGGLDPAVLVETGEDPFEC